jgi:hypothetical protein
MISIASDDLNSVTRWYFAVGGLQTQTDVLELSKAIRLERLRTFPTQAELAFSLDTPLVAGIMQHYGEAVIQHELIIEAEHVDDPQLIPMTAGAILAALRIRTGAEIICPAVCDTSWAKLRGLMGNSCRAYRVEPAMYSHEFTSPISVTPDDLDWTRSNLGKLVELNDDHRFETALDALCSYLHAANYRMMAAQLWAGVEAIFDVTYEISFRLPLLAALLLEKRGPKCRELKKQVKKLYTERSKAVHGGEISDEVLKQHVASVRSLLARLLAKIIQNGSLPSSDEFDDLTVLADSPTNVPDQS